MLTIEERRKSTEVEVKLRPTERKILSMLFLSNRDIGAILGLDVRTVEERVSVLLRKFGISGATRTKLALMAANEGYEIDWVLLNNTSRGELDWLIYPDDYRPGVRRLEHVEASM